MNTELLAALIGAIVGGVGSYLATYKLAERDRDRRRKSLATALLFELHMIDNMFDQLERTYSGYLTAGAVTLFEQATQHVELFDASATAAILEFRHYALSVYELTREAVTDDERPAARRNLARMLELSRPHTSAVRTALVRSGGTAPPRDLPVPSIPRADAGHG